MSLMYCMLAAGIGLSLLYTLERNLRITHLSAKPPPPPPFPALLAVRRATDGAARNRCCERSGCRRSRRKSRGTCSPAWR